jgi:hypothetical protein
MATQHQVIKFVLVDFRGDWKRSFSPDAGVLYEAVGPANEISVVKEVPGTGTATTYHYRLPAGAEAAVIEDVIHVPAICFKSEQGNTVKCG